jgi:hypothetical protein
MKVAGLIIVVLVAIGVYLFFDRRPLIKPIASIEVPTTSLELTESIATNTVVTLMTKAGLTGWVLEPDSRAGPSDKFLVRNAANASRGQMSIKGSDGKLVFAVCTLDTNAHILKAYLTRGK